MSNKTHQTILISEIFKSRKNILDILESQNYNTSDYSNFSINEVNSMHQNNQMDMLLEKNDNSKKIYIRYNLGNKISEAIILNFIEDLYDLSETLSKNDILYIVAKDEPNESIKHVLKQIWAKSKVYIIIDCIARLQYNILNHILVPNHRIMSQDEVQIMMDKYNILSLQQLPEINRFDPVAKVIGIKPNEVCEITRPSKAAIESKYYRVCV
jgi:DNA-directed RNA polymerase subunit H